MLTIHRGGRQVDTCTEYLITHVPDQDLAYGAALVEEVALSGDSLLPY